jgi:hypothetical protein
LSPPRSAIDRGPAQITCVPDVCVCCLSRHVSVFRDQVVTWCHLSYPTGAEIDAARPPSAEGLIRHATSIPRNTLGDHDDKRKLDNETLVRSNQRTPILSGSALIRKDDCGEDDNET